MAIGDIAVIGSGSLIDGVVIGAIATFHALVNALIVCPAMTTEPGTGGSPRKVSIPGIGFASVNGKRALAFASGRCTRPISPIVDEPKSMLTLAFVGWMYVIMLNVTLTLPPSPTL